jgi:hypothetical protein
VSKLLTILLGVFLLNAALGQTFPSQQWHEGEVILKDDVLVRGKLKYDLERDAVQVLIDKTIQTYSSQLVFKFSFHQEDIDLIRTFYTLPYEIQGGYKKIPRFFEVIMEGKMTLLAREFVAQVTTSSTGARFNRFRNYPLASTGPQSVTRYYLSYRMYFLDHEGNITEYTGRKKDLYRVLDENSNEVKKYVKSNKLKVDRLEDVAKLVAHYNTLI